MLNRNGSNDAPNTRVSDTGAARYATAGTATLYGYPSTIRNRMMLSTSRIVNGAPGGLAYTSEKKPAASTRYPDRSR